MNVSLPLELEAFVAQAVKSGRYASASEAIQEGLRLLLEREAKLQPLGVAVGSTPILGFHEAGNAARRAWEDKQILLRSALKPAAGV